MSDPAPQEAITEFNPEAPAPSPSKADFITMGMILDLAAADAAITVISKSVKVTDRPSAFIKTIYVQSDQAGTFDIEVMLDESERSGGNAVWRNIQPAVPVMANTLRAVSLSQLFQQVRIVYTPTDGPAVVKAWAFSIP